MFSDKLLSLKKKIVLLHPFRVYGLLAQLEREQERKKEGGGGGGVNVFFWVAIDCHQKCHCPKKRTLNSGFICLGEKEEEKKEGVVFFFRIQDFCRLGIQKIF